MVFLVASTFSSSLCDLDSERLLWSLFASMSTPLTLKQQTGILLCQAAADVADERDKRVEAQQVT